MAFIALEKLHRLYDGYRQPVRLFGREWLLIQEDGRLYCIANQCPHMGASLSQATTNGFNLRCSLHGLEFDLRTGLAVNPSLCQASLQFLPLIYEGNQVGIDLS